MALTKKEMISSLIEQANLDNQTATRSVEAIIELMKSALASGDDILVSGFGKFSVNEKNSRKGRNPATGEDLMLPSRKVITFKCSGKLRDRMNKPNE
jgi:integration host factor subunit alpha